MKRSASQWRIDGLIAMAIVGGLGCATAVRPPSRSTIGTYCLESAQEADARAIRHRLVGSAALGTAALSLAGAPMASEHIGDRQTGAIAVASLVTLAVGAAVIGVRALRVGDHEGAMASAFAGCIDAGDERIELAIARSVYQMWIRPDLSRAELVRRAVEAGLGAPMGPPPPPPPWADEEGPAPSELRSDSDILKADFWRPSQKTLPSP